MAEPAQPCVLLVDDAAANLLALRAILGSLDVRLVEASSGAEAVEHLERERFAVALLDVHMPGMDGFETAERLRALPNGRDLPIVFLTAADSDERDARRGYALGAADYVIKPLNADALRARTRTYVDLFRRTEQARAHLELRTQERDEAQRRLVAFERIATAALETDDLDAFLHSLLSVFLGAADSAETVSILLRQGDTLFVRASIGLGESLGFSIPVGRGFAGRVAATGEATLLVGDAICGAVEGPLLRTRGLRALYGVPLVSDRQVIGVAHIGSTRADSFTEAEMRVFRALIERTAWAVSRNHTRQRLFDVLDAAPVAIAIFRAPDYACEFANAASRRRFRGSDILTVSTPASGATPDLRALFERVIRGGETITLDEHGVTADWEGAGAEERILRLSLHPLRGVLGHPESVLTVAVDLTSQVRTRQALEKSERDRGRLLELERAARREAEIASGMKDEFLATVSHELRTPLNAILGWTTNARRGIAKDMDRVLATIERSARAQARMVDDVLDLSRVVSGKLRLNIVSMDISRVLGSATDAVRPAAEAKGVLLEIRIADDLGAISGDGDRLQQVVWNLLSNAVKFTPARGRVVLTASRTDQTIVVRVADTGQGIDPRFLPYVFDPFRQADPSSTRSHGGLGLGLAIAKQLAVAHGGTIDVASEGLGHGATFTLELPARITPIDVAAHRTTARDAASTSAPPPALRLDGMRVLVIDDETDCRDLVGDFLQHHGARVERAASAREGLDKVVSFWPNVIVSDLGMPGEDGYFFVRQLRALPRDRGGEIPALALTAYARAEDQQQALAAGYDEHIAKPVDLTHLLCRVAQRGAVDATVGLHLEHEAQTPCGPSGQ
jgi:signal transduction histidine kinase/DNA-binding response OmpR family regulator